MPKKITVVSGIALAALTAVIAALVCLRGKTEYEPPRRVSVYLPERREIVTVGYGEFLAGCVSEALADMPDIADEALCAVTAAMHSRAMYALSSKTGFQNMGADFTADAELPYNAERPPEARFLNAAEAAQTLLTYGGEPINARFCLISSGRTDEQPPVSVSVALPCDVGCDGFESRAVYTTEDVRRALHKSGALTADCSRWLSEPVYAESGTLLYILFNGERVSGAELRRALGLRSTAITVEYSEDKFAFTCLGYGDNKGMSVNAADFMARQGSTAEEILAVFYPGAELKKFRGSTG